MKIIWLHYCASNNWHASCLCWSSWLILVQFLTRKNCVILFTCFYSLESWVYSSTLVLLGMCQTCKQIITPKKKKMEELVISWNAQKEEDSAIKYTRSQLILRGKNCRIDLLILISRGMGTVFPKLLYFTSKVSD